MSSEPQPSAAAPAVTDFNHPKAREILYLDRPRLLSYASQLNGGLTRFRHLLEASQHGQFSTQPEYTRERRNDQENRGSGGVKAVLELGAEHMRSSGATNTVKSGGDGEGTLATTSLMEEIAVWDDLLLALEKQMTEAKMLTTYRGGEPESRLIQASGLLSIHNWTQVYALLDNVAVIRELIKDDPDYDAEHWLMKYDPKKSAGLSRALKMMVGQGMTAILSMGEDSIGAAINPGFLTMSVDQVRLMIEDDQIEASILAFVPRRVNKGQEEPEKRVSLKKIATPFTGEITMPVQPIAIYCDLV